MTSDELTAIERRTHAADVVVRALCHGAKWHMSIPVQPDDSDVIISATLNDGEALCREVRRLTAENAELRARPTLEQVMAALEDATWSTDYSNRVSAARAIRQLYAEKAPHD